jgi:hypothetical protein
MSICSYASSYLVRIILGPAECDDAAIERRVETVVGKS